MLKVEIALSTDIYLNNRETELYNSSSYDIYEVNLFKFHVLCNFKVMHLSACNLKNIFKKSKNHQV